MRRHAVALVAHQNASMRRQVQVALQTQNVDAVYARTCRDVRTALERRTPEIILTGTSFANGRWRDVVALARTAKPPVDVVLTLDEVKLSSDPESDSLHLESMDQDAFDLVVLPFGANVAQVLAHRFANPRAPQPALWRRPDSRVSSRFPGAGPAVSIAGGRKYRVLDQNGTRDLKHGHSELTATILTRGH